MKHLPSFVVAAALAFPACTVNLGMEGVTAQETHRFTVSGEPDLSVETFAGAIEVHSWDRPEIEIEVERRAMDQSLIDEMKVETTQDGNRVTLKVTGPSRYTGRGLSVGVNISPRARLRVVMPRQATLDVYSRDGAVAAEALAGTLTLRTDDGSIRATRLAGHVRLRTADGSIRLGEMEGGIDAETHDGSITLDGTLTMLRARTSDGSVRATIRDGSRLEADWEISTGDGGITLRLPTDLDAELNASTGDGRVRSSHPGLRLEGEDSRRNAVRAPIGNGGRTLTVRSGDGSIRIEH
jgi:hypothetical protein